MYELEEFKGYRKIGAHGAVKTCLWLKRSLRDEGACYKSKFYGITSHRCVQMSPVLSCNQFCVYCWRPAEFFKNHNEWDDPAYMAEEAIKAQIKLISGFKGSSKTNMKKFREAENPKHVAISLVGEPTLYPYLPDLIKEFTRKGLTTFLVSNGTIPEMIEVVEPTQLYISLSSCTKEMYKKINRPYGDFWDYILKSLKILSSKDTRTVIRLTLAKNTNMHYPEKYAHLINIARPDFIEVKAYMHLGYSRKRLSRESMPSHEEILQFSTDIAKHTQYDIVDQSEISRVVLLAE
jgi:tRNA wybutosine-synthesizing protein 1